MSFNELMNDILDILWFCKKYEIVNPQNYSRHKYWCNGVI